MHLLKLWMVGDWNFSDENLSVHDVRQTLWNKKIEVCFVKKM